jgi:outer membrane protein assembly factor BamB
VIGALALALLLGAQAQQDQPGVAAAAAAVDPTSATSDEGWVKPEKSELMRVLGARWKLELGDRKFLSSRPEEWTSPYISADRSRVYAALSDGQLVARSVESNEPIWNRRDLGSMGAGMAEYRGHLLVGSASSVLMLDDQSGNEVARIDIAAAIGGHMVVTGTIALIPTRPNTYLAIDLEKKTVVWRLKRPTPDGITLRGMATPTLDLKTRRAYLGFSDGSLAAVELDTGRELWSVALGKAGQGFADIDGQPQLVDNGQAVIAASYAGGLYKLEAESGRVLWKHEQLTRLTGLSTSGATGLILATHGDRQVLGIYPKSGKIRWRFRFTHGFPVEPVFLGGVLAAIGNAEEAIAILDVTTGKPVQLITTGSGVSASPAWRDPDLAVLSNKGMLLMLRLGSGTGITE